MKVLSTLELVELSFSSGNHARETTLESVGASLVFQFLGF